MAHPSDRPNAVQAGSSGPERTALVRIARKSRPFVIALAVMGCPSFARADASAPISPRKLSGSLDVAKGSLLVDYYEAFLRDHDPERFGLNVSARYTEAALVGLVEAPDVSVRRASMLALGLVGTFDSNAALARGLRDDDPVVRSLANQGLWSVWFRADSQENNGTLERVRALIDRRQYGQAIELATQLIAVAPRFAEAYNQRAIAHFMRGEFAESAEDCERVLERNPYHIGALGGLAQCQLRLDKAQDALKTLRRAAKLQPHDDSLRETISLLEAATAQ